MTPVKTLNARRLVMQDLQDRAVVTKLFDDLAPRFATRPGGYTRLLRVGFRRGDAAEMAQVELVGSEFNPRAKADADTKKAENAPKPKGVGGRLRAAAERLRGKKDDAETTATARRKSPPSEPSRSKKTEDIRPSIEYDRRPRQALRAFNTLAGLFFSASPERPSANRRFPVPGRGASHQTRVRPLRKVGEHSLKGVRVVFQAERVQTFHDARQAQVIVVGRMQPVRRTGLPGV